MDAFYFFKLQYPPTRMYVIMTPTATMSVVHMFCRQSRRIPSKIILERQQY